MRGAPPSVISLVSQVQLVWCWDNFVRTGRRLDGMDGGRLDAARLTLILVADALAKSEASEVTRCPVVAKPARISVTCQEGALLMTRGDTGSVVPKSEHTSRNQRRAGQVGGTTDGAPPVQAATAIR